MNNEKYAKYTKPKEIHNFGIRLGMYVQTHSNIVGKVLSYNEKHRDIDIKTLHDEFRSVKISDIKIVLTKESNPEMFL
ncbi:MAG: hypothetical protein J7L15_03785 [Clostridiales bacterium]|nr:hypothetical protein [Clostridiales bacterium]